MAGFKLAASSYNGDYSLCDYMFYVLPEHRNIENLGALLKEAQQFSRKTKMPLRVDFLCKNDTPLRERMLRKFGFETFAVVGVFNG
jgi:hypothetical protein